MQTDEVLLITKMALPAPTAATLPRNQLIELLSADPAMRLALVCAPAGFGKTTLLATWSRQQDAEGRHCAWITLDPDDNDAGRFLAYLRAVLADETPPATPPGAGDSCGEQTLRSLINHTANTRRESILVFDNYDVIHEPAVHAMVAYLLEHAPDNLRIAIGSRADPALPIAALRAHSRLVELHAKQLAFTLAEIRELAEMTGMRGSTEVLQAIECATEGWPAGVSLYLRAMWAARQHGSRRDGAYAPPGLDVGEQQALAFLAEDVYERQPAYLKRFLLETSILDRFCPSLCDAVLGVTLPKTSNHEEAPVPPDETQGECYSRVVLRELQQQHVFLLELDCQDHWFRYHHLFRMFLQERLTFEPAELRSLLHQRAAAWYRKHHDLERAELHRRAADALKHATSRPGPSNRDDAGAPAMSRADELPVEALSAREREVLALVARGASNHDIAAILVISLGTVKSHINHILGKLAAQNRTEAVAVARRLGLIERDAGPHLDHSEADRTGGNGPTSLAC